MISRKTIWIIVLSVCVFTAAYLYYVKKDREASITKFIVQPQPGDIYKMETETSEEGVFVYYLKIIKIDEQTIYFYRSKLIAGAAYDVLMEQFDPNITARYSKKDLAEIAAGKWMNASKEMTRLIEIERK